MSTRDQTIQLIRAAGWHYWEGETMGGGRSQMTLCRTCVHDEKRMSRKQIEIEQDSLPLSWEECKVEPRKVKSRKPRDQA